jgi:hypothetical protein
MADSISFRERIGLRRASGVGEAGWGRTLVAASMVPPRSRYAMALMTRSSPA